MARRHSPDSALIDVRAHIAARYERALALTERIGLADRFPASPHPAFATHAQHSNPWPAQLAQVDQLAPLRVSTAWLPEPHRTHWRNRHVYRVHVAADGTVHADHPPRSHGAP